MQIYNDDIFGWCLVSDLLLVLVFDGMIEGRLVVVEDLLLKNGWFCAVLCCIICCRIIRAVL